MGSVRQLLPAAKRDVADGFDLVMSYALYGLLAFTPLALGGVEAWSRLIFFSVVMGLALCLTAKLAVCRSARFVWSWSYVPLLLFIAFAALQSVHLPASIVRLISPQTMVLKAQLTGDVPGAAGPLAHPTLSFYPFGTRYDLRLVLAAAIVLVVVLNVFRTGARIMQLLAAIAVVGGAMALIALAQDLSGAVRIFGVVPVPASAKANGGTFINHSHFAQFMNLSIGAALGLLLVRLAEGTPHRESSASRSRSGSFSEGWSDRPAKFAWPACVVVAGAVSIVLSLSRGGIAAMLVAGIALTVAMVITRRTSGGRGSLLAALGLIVFAGVLYFGFEPVYNRFATRQDIDSYGGRGQILKDLTILFRRFPLVGTGLGTHAVVFPMVDRSIAGQTAAFAENDYAQLLEETGIVGALLTLMFIAALVATYVRCLRRSEAISWAALGLGFGLLAVMVHSLSDFGQHMPANALLSAASCALLFCILRTPSPSSGHAAATDQSGAGQPLVRWSGVVFAACLAGSLGMLLPGAFAARSATQHWARATRDAEALRRAHWRGSDDQYNDLIREARLANECEPDNVMYRYRLNEFRWRALSRGRDGQKTGWVLTPTMAADVREIVADLHQARLLCPTFGSAAALAGQLEWYILGMRVGVDHIRLGYRLSSQDSATAFVAGQVEAGEKNWDESARAMRRAIALDASLLPEAMRIFVEVEDRPDLAFEFAGDKPEPLLQLADGLERMGVHLDWSVRSRDRAFELLQNRCSAPNAGSGDLMLLAEMFLKKKQSARAIELYRRALVFGYGNADLHLRLARLLAEDGQSAAAVKEARICLRLNPGNREASALISQLPSEEGKGSSEK